MVCACVRVSVIVHQEGKKGNVMVSVRTILGDEIQPIGVQPHQLNIERVYPIFETFDPCDGVR